MESVGHAPQGAQTRFDTCGVAETERFGYWQEIVGALFPAAEIRPIGPAPFAGSIARRNIGALALSDIRSVAQRVIRSPRHVARSDDEVFELNLQLSGTGFLAQDDRETTTRPGDFTLYDSTRPFEMRFDGPFRQLSFKLPRRLLSERIWSAERLTAIRMSRGEGVGGAVFAFLCALGDLGGACDGPTMSRLQDHTLDLVATALRDRAAGATGGKASSGQRAALARLKTFIGANLGDPELSAESLARANRVSVRTVYALFAVEGSTPGKWIQSARLEACRRDLEEALQDRRPIGSIAFDRGFNDAAHFSRLFRARYGLSPRAWAAGRRKA